MRTIANKREIKTTIALDGEAKFKQNLKSIDGSLRVLASELGAVTSGYDKNNKSVEDLQKTNKVLEKQIELQKSKLSALQGAVDDSTKAYDAAVKKAEAMAKEFGENSEQAILAANAVMKAEKAVNDYQIQANKAQAALNKMESALKANQDEMAEMGKATEKSAGELEEIKKAKTEEALKKIKEQAEKLGAALVKVAEASGKVAKMGFDTVTTAVNGGIKALKIYTGAVTGASTALFGLSAKAGSWADDINTLSATTGLSTAELQKFEYATDLIDVSIETLSTSMSRNIKSMNSARAGTGATADAYRRLGVAVVDANGELRDGQTVFNESIRALGDIANETERDAIAMELFGRSARDLNPLIEGGIDDLEALGNSAEQLGLILSQDALDDLNSFNDSLDILKANASASGRVIAGAFAGEFKIATDIIGNAVPVLARGFAELFGGDDVEGAANHLTDVLTDLGKDILSKITEELPQFLERFNAFIMAIASSTIENLPTVINEILPALIKGLTDLVRKATKLLPTLLPLLVDGAMTLFTGILDGLNQVIDLLLPMLPGIVQQICDTLVTNLPLIIEGGITLLMGLITGISTSMPMIVQTIVDMMPMITNTIMVNLPLILQAGIDILLSIIDGIVQMLPDLIPTIVQAVILICDVLLENLPLIIDAAIEIIVALVEGLAEAMPKLVEYLPKIIIKICDTLIEKLPLLLDAALEIMIALGEGLIKCIPDLVKAVPKIFMGIFNAFKKLDWGKIGKDLMAGIGKGITQGLTALLDTVKETAEKVVNGVKSFFGIHSPSTLFRDEIGLNMAAGIGVGFENEMDKVAKDMQNAIPTDFDTAINATASGVMSGNKTINNSSNTTVNYYISDVKITSDDDIESLAYKLEFNRLKASAAIGVY